MNDAIKARVETEFCDGAIRASYWGMVSDDLREKVKKTNYVIAGIVIVEIIALLYRDSLAWLLPVGGVGVGICGMILGGSLQDKLGVSIKAYVFWGWYATYFEGLLQRVESEEDVSSKEIDVMIHLADLISASTRSKLGENREFVEIASEQFWKDHPDRVSQAA